MSANTQRGKSESAEKNAGLCLMLWALAEANGDQQRVDLARAGLRECGYPGGEDAPSIEDAMQAIEGRP